MERRGAARGLAEVLLARRDLLPGAMKVMGTGAIRS